MATTHRTRLINPRLGAYFSIFASAFAALFLLLLILEQLGTSDSLVRASVLFVPLVLFVAIGTASLTRTPTEFFAAGRRVPAVYNGLVLAIAATGGTGLVVFTGLLFLNGFDAWCLFLGTTAGFVVMGVMVAPYMRKYGGYTVPSYLARRFSNRTLRIVSAAVFAVPMLLLLTAELHMAGYAMELLTGYTPGQTAMIIAATLSAVLVFGGMRAMSWVGTAQAMATILAIVVPAAMLGVMETNLPLAQFSYGPVLRGIGRMEFAQQIPAPELSVLAFDLADNALTDIKRRLATPHGSLGPLSFALLTLTAGLGIACAPWLLPRCGTTVGVYEARKSLGWTVFFLGVIMLTLSALAIFMRNFVMHELVGQVEATLPEWFRLLVGMGSASVNDTGGPLQLQDFAMNRDSVLFAVPLAAGFPAVVLYLTLAGAIAAALAAAAATVYALATILTEDIVHGLHWTSPEPASRVMTGRVLIAAVVALGLLFASLIDTDPLQLLLWALSISGAAAFPCIIMSIWWKRLSGSAAMASLLTGFVVSVSAILMGESWLIPLPGPLIGLAGFVPAVIVAVLVSLFGPAPDRQGHELVRDIRIPGGETIFDREQRLLRLQEQKRSS